MLGKLQGCCRIPLLRFPSGWNPSTSSSAASKFMTCTRRDHGGRPGASTVPAFQMYRISLFNDPHWLRDLKWNNGSKQHSNRIYPSFEVAKLTTVALSGPPTALTKHGTSDTLLFQLITYVSNISCSPRRKSLQGTGAS